MSSLPWPDAIVVHPQRIVGRPVGIGLTLTEHDLSGELVLFGGHGLVRQHLSFFFRLFTRFHLFHNFLPEFCRMHFLEIITCKS